jgi:hypothetical protein
MFKNVCLFALISKRCSTLVLRKREKNVYRKTDRDVENLAKNRFGGKSLHTSGRKSNCTFLKSAQNSTCFHIVDIFKELFQKIVK